LRFKNAYATIVDKFKHPERGAIQFLTDIEKKMILRENILDLIR